MSAPARRPDYDPQTELEVAQAEIFASQAQRAVERLDALLAAEPQHLIAAYWLAAAKGAAGDWAGFATDLRDTRNRHALGVIARAGGDLNALLSDPAYAKQVGDAAYRTGAVAIASAAYGCMAADPAAPAAGLLSYGLSLQHQGRVDEALEAFRRACAAAPDSALARSFLLYILFQVPDGVRRHAEEAIRWSQTYVRQPLPAPSSFPNPPLAGRKLRLGYVCPSVSGQLRQFLTPVLENHDRETTHVTVYVNDPPPFELGADEVRVVGGAPDAEVAQLIRADGIDVLIDLWGHTAGCRLGVFGLKPAPVQASWMNYVQTTGLEAIDYLMHPDCLETPDAQAFCVEKIWYIGNVMGPFRPDPRPDPTPTPAKANGFVTFGSYNHPIRLNDQTVAAWARILCATPNSRLVLRYSYFTDEVLQNVTLMRFAAHGVLPDRIQFHGMVRQPEYYQSYAEIDIALDSAPCPGGTTSLDALANGVPLLTLAGRDYYSRIGICAVGPLGLDDLVVGDWDAYVARAVELASDIAALDALRLKVRLAFDASPRRDEMGFTRRIEGEFARMFAIWRQRRDAEA